MSAATPSPRVAAPRSLISASAATPAPPPPTAPTTIGGAIKAQTPKTTSIVPDTSINVRSMSLPPREDL
jgi:hypothetical protein